MKASAPDSLNNKPYTFSCGMSRTFSRRLWASCLSIGRCTSSPSSSINRRLSVRQFSTSPIHDAQEKQPTKQSQALADLAGLIGQSSATSSTAPSTNSPLLSYLSPLASYAPVDAEYEEPHHLHVFSHKRNTHITLTKPNREGLLHVTCGSIGFRKSNRKHYDSAFQTASYALGRIQESGLGLEIKKLEVVLRGFGHGREALIKALLGTEGKFLRHKIVRVTDATRLKIGGCRSKNPRRL